MFSSNMFRRKPLEPTAESQLERTLTAVDLILYGVGCSVGAGIYCLVGIGAVLAGPAITLSFLSCGTACVFTSLAYAEFAARIPVTGSAYVYSYCTFGEIWGWLVGWNLTLGYGFTASVVARSWAEYVATWIGGFAQRAGYSSLDWLAYLTKVPLYGDYTCSPLSMVVIALCTWILMAGAKESSRFNNFMTIFNIFVLLLVIVAGTPEINFDNLTPFAPNGISGVTEGAGLVFFAFIGFDMVACLSEEVIDPERNMPLGIVGSLIISATLYIVISLVVIGMAPIQLLGGDVPITNALLANACCSHESQVATDAAEICLSSTCSPVLNPFLSFCSRFVSVGAIFALTAATFVGLMGQPRIFYSMAQDGLLFPIFGKIDPVSRVPTAGIVITGMVTAVLACFVDLEVLANVISLGTLMVFTFVDAAVVILRLRPWHRPVSVTPNSYVLQTPTVSRQNSFASSNRNQKSSTNWLLVWQGTSVRQNGSKPTVLVSIFSLSMLLFSIAIRDSWTKEIPLFLALVAGFCVLLLSSLPRSEPPDTFRCPLVPIVPLLGMAANLYMMGALPTTAWFLTGLWLVLGASVYFLYGIHNSKLGKRQEDAAPAEAEVKLLINPDLPNYTQIGSTTLLPPKKKAAPVYAGVR